MIAVLSPAKNMISTAVRKPLQNPQFLNEAAVLCTYLKTFSNWELESLLHINPEIALRAYESFQHFDPAAVGTPAVLSYHGLAYQHLQADDFDEDELHFADQHLRLLSAFYGLLRPTDSLQPYRLEFLCKAKPDGKSLYAFWGDKVCHALFQEDNTVINLASAEYAKLLRPHLLPENRLITCDFLISRRGKLVALATESKMARGEMARFLIRGCLQDPEQLREFCWNGYRYAPLLSTESRYAFFKEND